MCFKGVAFRWEEREDSRNSEVEEDFEHFKTSSSGTLQYNTVALIDSDNNDNGLAGKQTSTRESIRKFTNVLIVLGSTH